MSKAEDLAKELYPDWEVTGVPKIDGQEESMVRIQRVAYIKGYHQAEKDLELTWEDMRLIDRIASKLLLLRQEDDRDFYQEVLKRFKEMKKN